MKKQFLYLLTSIICFGLCVMIVLIFNNHQLIRGFIGDIIVMILIYSLVKSVFVEINPLKLCIGILLFSYAVELLQLFRFVKIIGLGDSRIAKIVFGSVFDFKDLVAYTIGAIIAVLLDINVVAKIYER